MQLDATTRAPPVAQAKSGACGNLDITETAYVGVARFLVAPVINERHFKSYSPILPVANAPSPLASQRPSSLFRTVFELVPFCVQQYTRLDDSLIV